MVVLRSRLRSRSLVLGQATATDHGSRLRAEIWGRGPIPGTRIRSSRFRSSSSHAHHLTHIARMGGVSFTLNAPAQKIATKFFPEARRRFRSRLLACPAGGESLSGVLFQPALLPESKLRRFRRSVKRRYRR